MGGPKPNKNVNQAFQTNLGQQRDFQNATMGGLSGSQGRADQVFNAQLGGYQNLLSGLQNPQTGGGGGGGQNAAMQAAIAAIQGAGGGPNISGLVNDIRARGGSLLPAFYDRIKEEQTRLQNIQGGYNPGYTSQMSKLARDQAQSMQKQQLDTEIQVQKMQQQAAAQANAMAMQKAGMLASLARGGGGGGGGSSADDSFRQQMSILGAMGQLRGQAPGEVGMYLQGGLGGLEAGRGAAGQYAQYNPATVPGWQRALGAVGGVAGGLFGGGFNPFGGGGGGGGQTNYGGGFY